jgi:hypothetical protein
MISNTERPLAPLPIRGQRVDGGDGTFGFQVVEEPAEPSPGSSGSGGSEKP